ncbi:MAG: RNA 2',3'-cyclic phosphodiesterase [Anaerolineaceae bacterium]|nr:RNA 2',3'-cyclic phosphodiesterase [Anaerolineaceae bacterium]
MTTLRTFIAIDLSPELRANLGDLQDRLRGELGRGSVRWVQPQGIHLTLKFLGDTPREQLDAIQRALTRAAATAEPFTISAGGVGCFPNTRQPRVVWVGLEEASGALLRLRNAVESEVSPLGFPIEKRPFHPHLTLGRVQRGASSGDARRVGQVVAATTTGDLGEMAVSTVSFIKSDLRPSGAVYTTLSEAGLGRG